MTTNHDLAKEIEDLVRQHVDTLRTTAAAAVTRAFTTVARHEPERAPNVARRRAKSSPRRASGELIALGERFYAVLCRHPGETMAALAPQVGVAPRVLQVAVTRLRRDGRVRVIGKKQHTRYYPLATSPSAASAATTAAAA
jgi:hypothetical protein